MAATWNTKQHHSSTFFALPFELRLRILSLALTPHTLHVSNEDGQIFTYLGTSTSPSCHVTLPGTMDTMPSQMSEFRPTWMMVNRQWWQEMSVLLYSTVVWTFRNVTEALHCINRMSKASRGRICQIAFHLETAEPGTLRVAAAQRLQRLLQNEMPNLNFIHLQLDLQVFEAPKTSWSSAIPGQSFERDRLAAICVGEWTWAGIEARFSILKIPTMNEFLRALKLVCGDNMVRSDDSTENTVEITIKRDLVGERTSS